MLFTDEESILADSLKSGAKHLARLALSGDDMGLFQELEFLCKEAIAKGRGSLKKKSAQEPRRQQVRGNEKASQRGYRKESIDADDAFLLEERLDKNVWDKVVAVLSNPGEKSNNSRLKIAQAMLRTYNEGSKSYMNVFKRAIDIIKQKLGLSESVLREESVLHGIKVMLAEADDDDKKGDKPSTSAPSKDRDTGEILYHLDMATRHLDVLVDYTLVAGHEDDVVNISTAVQKLAQGLRGELEAQRTPYDEPEVAPEQPQQRPRGVS